MAAIDLYASEIAWAYANKKTEAMALIAHAFYSRLGFTDKLPAIDPYDVVAVKAVESGFWIKFKDGTYLHHTRRPERWCISKSDTDKPKPFDSHDFVIEKMCVPFAFLQGIAFAFDCIENTSRESVSLFVEEAEKKTRQEAEKADQALSSFCHWHNQARLARDKHKRLTEEVRASVGESVLKQGGVVIVPAASDNEPPPPPTSSISMLAAKALFAGKSGIYFLWRDDEIVYVGRANCISTRLSGHHVAEPTDFVSVVEMPAGESWVAEPYYIWKLRPRLNGEVVTMMNVNAGKPSRAGKRRKKKALAK